MAGHSKWNNIKHKKEKTDAQRGKIFTKIGREISVAVREGGPDPESNSKLKDIIAKAKSLNVPNENIERNIKKASDNDKDNYEQITYEGYGPCGVAVIVDCLTDNRNRTAGDLRHYFDKFGGNLGQTGCVSFMFERKGVILIEDENVDEEKAMEDIMEADASDFTFSEEGIEVLTDTASLKNVRDALIDKGYAIASAEIEYVPSTYTKIPDEDSQTKMEKLLDILEDNDDVQNVWHNWED